MVWYLDSAVVCAYMSSGTGWITEPSQSSSGVSHEFKTRSGLWEVNLLPGSGEDKPWFYFPPSPLYRPVGTVKREANTEDRYFYCHRQNARRCYGFAAARLRSLHQPSPNSMFCHQVTRAARTNRFQGPPPTNPTPMRRRGRARITRP